MACVIYKGNEKLLVDPAALNGMLAQGWSLHPQEVKLPTAEEFEEYLNLHEELKRVSDEALTARDNQIADLVLHNEQLTEDIEVLEAENIELRDRMVHALEELKALKQQAPKLPNPNENEDENLKIVQDYKDLTVRQLKARAKQAEIPNYQLMRKAQLIEALEDGSESQN